MAWISSLRERAGRLVGQGLDLLCPPRCVLCRAEVADPETVPAVVCEACVRRLGCEPARCRVCGRPATEPGSCPCRGRCRDWDGIAVLAGYDGELREAVLAAKRPAGELIAAGLASLLVRQHGRTISEWGVDLVVPVPMHWQRRVRRGGSLADALARPLAAGLRLPCRGVLTRTRATVMQNELEPQLRPANVRGAFRAGPRAAGRRVLLVDDVTTTGGTLAACRTALDKAGAAAVFAAVVARADRRSG